MCIYLDFAWNYCSLLNKLQLFFFSCKSLVKFVLIVDSFKHLCMGLIARLRFFPTDINFARFVRFLWSSRAYSAYSCFVVCLLYCFCQYSLQFYDFSTFSLRFYKFPSSILVDLDSVSSTQKTPVGIYSYFEYLNFFS